MEVQLGHADLKQLGKPDPGAAKIAVANDYLREFIISRARRMGIRVQDYDIRVECATGRVYAVEAQPEDIEITFE